MILRILLFLLYLSNVNKLFSEEKAKNAHIFLSTIHAYYTTIISLLYLLDVNLVVTYCTELIFLSAYYALYDIYIQHKYRLKNRIPLTIHHLLILLGLVLLLNYYDNDISKKTLVAYNFLTEISTPFLNKSIILYNQNMNHHINYKISIYMLVLTFFCSRVLGGIYFIYLSSFQPLFITFSQTTLSSLNLMWFYKIIQMIKNI